MNENTKMKVEESVLTIGTIFYLSVNILIWCYFFGVLE
jgi:hypothetical protein